MMVIWAVRVPAHGRSADNTGATAWRRVVNWEHLNVFHPASKVMAHEVVPPIRTWVTGATIPGWSRRPRVRKMVIRGAIKGAAILVRPFHAP